MVWKMARWCGTRFPFLESFWQSRRRQSSTGDAFFLCAAAAWARASQVFGGFQVAMAALIGELKERLLAVERSAGFEQRALSLRSAQEFFQLSKGSKRNFSDCRTAVPAMYCWQRVRDWVCSRRCPSRRGRQQRPVQGCVR